MTQFILNTEDFSDTAAWTPFDVTITANAQAAPAFASPYARLASNINDPSAALQGYLEGVYFSIPNDSQVYTASWHIRKLGSAPSVGAKLGLQLVNGTGVDHAIEFDAFTGVAANSPVNGGPSSFGVIDLDALWWRVWYTDSNNSTGNNAMRPYMAPALTTLPPGTGGESSAGIGSLDIWGANVTNIATVQVYASNPLRAAPFELTRRDSIFIF